MNTMITIGDHTFPFELAVFEKHGNSYIVTLPHNDMKDGIVNPFQIGVYDKTEVQAIDMYLHRNAVSLIHWREKMMQPKEDTTAWQKNTCIECERRYVVPHGDMSQYCPDCRDT